MISFGYCSLQMSAVDAPFIEVLDIFETGGTDGMSKDSVNKIEKIEISMENNVDSSGEKMCCLVCLQVSLSIIFLELHDVCLQCVRLLTIPFFISSGLPNWGNGEVLASL